MIEKLNIAPAPWGIKKCRDYCGSKHCHHEWPGPGSWVQGAGYSPDNAKMVAASPEMLEALIAYTLANEKERGCQWAVEIIEKATGMDWETIKGRVYG